MNWFISKVVKRVVYTFQKTKILLGIFLMFLIVFSEGITASGSMEPTIMTGDLTLGINTLFWYTPKRGDIVTFRHDDQLWEKRIIGLPGDMIVIKDSVVYIDGEPLEEDYIPDDVYTFSGIHSIYYVPEGHVMVMGDNRENSNDSRYWEDPYVDMSSIVIKHLFTVVNLPWYHTSVEEQLVG